MSQRIYIDPHKTDGSGGLLLTSVGTQADIARLGIRLREGLLLDFYTDDADNTGHRDDLLFSGVVRFNSRIDAWVAEIDWGSTADASDAHADR